MLAELLENIETETDIIIKDRGLFDALVWLELQQKRGEVLPAEASQIENFLLLDRWKNLIDMVVLFTVSPGESLLREAGPHITEEGGSVMNPKVLDRLNSAANEAEKRYANKFKKFVSIDTTNSSATETGFRLAKEILETMTEFLNPEVLVVSRESLTELPLANDGVFSQDGVNAATALIRSQAKFMRRADAEENQEFVQIIPCAALFNEERVFTFEREETDPKYQLYGRTTIWQGCHVPKLTAAENLDFAEILSERIRERLFLSRRFPIRAIGYTWDREDPRSARHFGLVHRMEIDSDAVIADLQKKAFRRRRGYDVIGQFSAVSDVRQNQDKVNLESWSRAILNGLGG